MDLYLGECPTCESADLLITMRKRTITFNGKTFTINQDEITKCNLCSEEFYSGTQAQLADKRLAEAKLK